MSLIKIIPSRASSREINRHLARLGLPPKRNLHTTVFYTEETPIFRTAAVRKIFSDSLPIIIDPGTYRFAIFDSHLVLRYDNPSVKDLYNRLLGEAARQCIRGYPDAAPARILESLAHHLSRRRVSSLYPFRAHITLLKDYSGDTSGLQLPEFPIVFDRNQLTELN